ncbi:putative ADP-ribosylation factor-like 2, arl2 [Trypanosoma theileri]|uniref:Putative ADP-ribosylation factor-like 2, arl2 n=1 Tax=Trypanosoma theileri TaxID=67003 RepID=A0A1X0P0X5_9TRYP|nr:putative ADP-ribosylation factor-like 2, arl2 [Trypanosoma theileri]ORC90363.1 putative ADP-ribosylation factor-like 2, arl2 [Trypanosoma theileri]
MDQQQAQQEEGNVMGVVRSAYEKGRTSFMMYKKRFWVVDESQARLEVYKNDQEPFPQTKFDASDVRGVVFSGGKQNKFFGLALQLRKGRNIKFRLNSIEDRDRWYNAIMRLIKRNSAYNHDQNVLRVAQRRTLTAERLLGVSITLTVARLSDIPDDILQYLVDAVDAAIETISEVVHTYGGDMEIPRRYIVTVASADSQTRCGPQYDPSTSSLVLQVLITRDIFGHVRFNVADPIDIIDMTQSHVWRDPRIEGWISTNPKCMAVCREIGELLGLKKSFSFTFQWGQNMRDTERVGRYLHRYVHEDFLRSVEMQIVEVAEDFKRSQGSNDDVQYIKYIGDYVSGIAITLDEVTVNADRPPDLSVVTTVEYQRRCRRAVLITSKYLEAYRQPRVVSKTLRDQLVEVILLADLSRRLSESKSAFSQVLGGEKSVKFLWENLLLSCAQINVPLKQRNLSQLVTSCTNIYLERLESVEQLMSGIDSPIDGTVYPFAVMFKNVYSIVVDFVPFIPGSMTTLPELRFRQGILTDCIVCSVESTQKAMMDVICRHRPVPQINQAYGITRNLFVFPSVLVTTFKDWCERELCNTQTPVEQINGDDSSSWSSSPSDDLGDAVAFERSAETQVLDIHRVVNIVYDSQGASVNLKIGADAIREAINALEAAFDGRRIRKHDLARVLIANLRRLRAMYSQTIGGEMVSCLHLDAAVQLLYELCEYEENEVGLRELLQQYAQERRKISSGPGNEPISQSNEDVPRTLSDRIYDFQCVSHVALNYLLPREARIALLAWRVGFVAGLESVGKTLILNSVKGYAQSTIPTVGLSQRVVAFEEWVFAMNELGGRESFRENWHYYVERMESIDFLIFVVDSMQRRTYKDAAEYLLAITNHFKTLPLVIVFNNYRSGTRGTPTLADLETAVKLDKVRRRHPDRRVFVGTCDITVVSSANRTAPSSLTSALQDLSAYLRQISPPDRRPRKPKQVGAAEAMMQRLSMSMGWRL